MNQQDQNNYEKKLEVLKRQHEHSEENQNNYEKKLEVKKRKHEHSKQDQNNFEKNLKAWCSWLFQSRLPDDVYVYFVDKTTVNDDENKYEKNTEVRRRNNI